MTRLPAATSSASEVRGFCTATTFRPLAWRIGMTLSQLEPSANAPWISTTVFCSVACAIAIQGSINEMSNNLNMLLLLKGPPLPDTGKCTASVYSKSCGCFRHHGGLLTKRTVCCASPTESRYAKHRRDHSRVVEVKPLYDGIGRYIDIVGAASGVHTSVSINVSGRARIP